MISITQIDMFIKSLESSVETLQGAMDRFATRFAEDPVDALSWGHGTFQDAAKLNVAQGLLRMIAEGREHGSTDMEIFQEMRRVLLRNALQGARYPECSTSPSSNLMAQCKTAASVDFLDSVNNRIEWIESEGK